MSVQPMDFYGELLLLGKKNRAYGAPAVLAEMTAVSTALSTDPTTHDVTVALPPAPVKPDPSQTDFTNAALLLVNKGKGGNLANATMKAAIDAALVLIAPPTNTVAPVATGNGTIPGNMSCTTGTWANSPTAYAYQWMRGAAEIAGATNPTYVTVAADGGTSVSCRVTASNASGSASASSNAIAIQGVPVNTTPPAVSGNSGGPGVGAVGDVLTTTNGTWTNAPITLYAQTWLRNGLAFGAPPNVMTYTTVAADNGTIITCRVWAYNAAGQSAPSDSNTIAMGAPFLSGAAPVIVGSTVQGATLTMTSYGGWSTGASPTTLSWQWRRNGVDIAGTNSTAYTTVGADVGAMIDCVVTRTTAGGPGSAPSNAIGPITATATGDEPDYIAPMPTIPRVQQRIRAREAARQERRP
jgi:hypothetical protein